MAQCLHIAWVMGIIVLVTSASTLRAAADVLAVKKLEEALTCTGIFKPQSLLFQLQREGAIGRTPVIQDDGIPIFAVSKRLRIYGLDVKFIEGWDFEGPLFRRGPGTAPPVHVGIIVDADKTIVQSILPSKRFDIGNKIETFRYISEPYMPERYSDMGRQLSEIICSIPWSTPPKWFIAAPSPAPAPPEAKSPKQDATTTGSGFFVSDEGHIVTNAHVVSQCTTIRLPSGSVLRTLAVDAQSDLALLRAIVKPPSFARLQGGRGVRSGDSVVAIGFPYSGALASEPTVTTGTVSALTGMGDDRRNIQITAPVQPGNSGGPLLGSTGAIVGVVVGKLNAIEIAKLTGDIPQNVNFAVSLGTLQSFLNTYGVPYELSSGTSNESPADIAAEAVQYVVNIQCLQ